MVIFRKTIGWLFSHWYGAEGGCRAHQQSPEGHLGLDLCREIWLQIPVWCSRVLQGSWAGCALLLTSQQEQFGWGSPSVPLLIPPEGIRALCFLRAISGCNLLLLRALPRMLLRCTAGFVLGGCCSAAAIPFCWKLRGIHRGVCLLQGLSVGIRALYWALQLSPSSLLYSHNIENKYFTGICLLWVCFQCSSSRFWVLFPQSFRKPLNVNSVSFTYLIVSLQLFFIIFSYSYCLHNFHKVVHIDSWKIIFYSHLRLLKFSCVSQGK